MICSVCRHCGLCEGDGHDSRTNSTLAFGSGFMFRSPQGDHSASANEIGIAIDIGTTTICAAAYRLHNAARLFERGEPNDQHKFGSDVIARIAFSATPEGHKALHTTLINQLERMISHVLRALSAQCLATRQPEPALRRLVIAGNTTMQSLCMGLSVSGLASFPFEPPSLFGCTVDAESVFGTQSAVPASCELYVPPIAGAFVGGDAVCAMTACGFFSGSTSTPLLLADVGTNCEIAAFNPVAHTLVCTSTAAGPAFEGQGISCGMGAREGAIASISISLGGQISSQVIGGRMARGLCGTGLLSAVAALYISGRLSADGAFTNGDSRVQLAPTVWLSQNDVRAFQLAKAAVRTGLDAVQEHSAIKDGTLFLAGGFGTSLSTADARAVGMIPPDSAIKTVGAGNAALCGAALLLIEPHERQKCQAAIKTANVIDLAKAPTFGQQFIKNLPFPKNTAQLQQTKEHNPPE